jgi:hypothetical protein
MSMPPIQLLPYPDGKDFAVSFVDDTDLSTRENTEPVYDLLDSLNIRGTKTIWVSQQKRTSSFRKENEKPISPHGNSGSTLENKEYLEFILDLQQKGFEIALHGVAAGNSYRQETIDGIERYKTLLGSYPKINIFHERNRENLYAGNDKLDFWPFKVLERVTDNSDYQGHIEGSPYFWGDIAKSIKYMRLPFHTIAEANTLELNSSMPFHDPKRPYVNYWFASSDGSDCQRFNKLLSDANVKRLEIENGVCLIYTHFAKGFCYKKNDEYVLNKEFLGVMSNLGSHQNVWCPTASELLDRLLICKNVLIKQRGYDVLVHNRGDQDIDSLALKIAPGIFLTEENGLTQVLHAPGRIILSKLSAGTTIALRSNQRRNITIQSKNFQNISRCERMKIEIANYYGLLKQRFLQ